MKSFRDLNLILASGSPRRKQLLSELGLDFEIIVSDVNESIQINVSPNEYVCIVAQRKAEAVRQLIEKKSVETDKETIIISADTTVSIDGMILGKPCSEEEAITMLERLQGKQHAVYSAICLMKTQSKSILVDYLETKVHVKPLSSEQIKGYVSTGEPMDKAGAYAIQGIGSTLISGIEGDYFNVVGLSLSLLSDMFAKWGYSFF